MSKMMIVVALIVIIIVIAAFFLILSKIPPSGVTGASAQTIAENAVQQELNNIAASNTQDIESALVQ